jgi:hypothetical protein
MGVLHALVRTLAALVILFEEWGWEPLQALFARLAAIPPWAWLERRIARLPPRGAVLVCFVPALALLPVKLTALWLLGRGQALSGFAVIVVAKVAGTALQARLYTLTRPALMQLAWFARWHARWTVWKTALLAQVRASWVWREARRLRHRFSTRAERDRPGRLDDR